MTYSFTARWPVLGWRRALGGRTLHRIPTKHAATALGSQVRALCGYVPSGYWLEPGDELPASRYDSTTRRAPRCRACAILEEARQ